MGSPRNPARRIVGPAAIPRVALDGDAARNDRVPDFAQVEGSRALSPWGNSGGAPVQRVRAEGRSASWSGDTALRSRSPAVPCS
jgi:hypothetical protein